MTKYQVTRPENQSTRREFSNMRKAKKYARTLGAGAVISEIASPWRYASINLDLTLNCLHCPESWRLR